MSTLKTGQNEPPFEGEGNTARLNFRITPSMKDQLTLLMEFEMTGSVGELARGVLRDHITKVTNSKTYQAWLQKKEAKRE